MRKLEEIIKDFKALEENDAPILLKSYKDEFGGVTEEYGWKNDEKRRRLNDEYIETLPENQRLAIFLHRKTCMMDHNAVCSWEYEFKGYIDDWDGPRHAEFLQKANQMLSKSDYETIINELMGKEESNSK